MPKLFALAALAAVLIAEAPVPAQAPAGGAFATGRYRNLFAEADPHIAEAEIRARLDAYWNSLFGGDPERRVYYPATPNANGPTAYIHDIHNDDVRSEGMSYGMMIAVQMNRKAEFDALWNWARTNMHYASGPRAGYFRWQCMPDGCARDAVPASDGEEYFAMALFFAAHRWGNGAGIYDYESEANAILDTMLHKEDMNGGVIESVTNMFDRGQHQVVFVPNGNWAGFTDPSYHLPA
jgi:endo-1,4-beta-D-glucanase Y